MLCQLLAKAVSLPNQKGNTALILAKLSGVLINESARVKLFWLVPVLWVIHDPSKVSID